MKDLVLAQGNNIGPGGVWTHEWLFILKKQAGQSESAVTTLKSQQHRNLSALETTVCLLLSYYPSISFYFGGGVSHHIYFLIKYEGYAWREINFIWREIGMALCEHLQRRPSSSCERKKMDKNILFPLVSGIVRAHTYTRARTRALTLHTRYWSRTHKLNCKLVKSYDGSRFLFVLFCFLRYGATTICKKNLWRHTVFCN